MATHSVRLKDWIRLLQSRLSLRIVLWIFVSITLIAMILLVPSVDRQRQEILTQIQEVSTGKINWLLITYPDADGTELLRRVQQLRQDPMLQMVMGGAVYTPDGELVGTFGETPTLSFADAREEGSLMVQSQVGDRYDVAWVASQLPENYVIILRHNADGTQAELIAYILRIIGLVLIIAAFVTLVMMMILGVIVIRPILTLRQDLAIAGTTIRDDCGIPRFKSIQLRRNDELGEVIQTFQQMFGQICEAIARRKRAEANLRQNNESMRQYLDQVDRVTAAAAALENEVFDPESLTEVATRDDELGKLARVFQEMATHIQRREEQLRQQVADLKIEIDEAKRSQEVAILTQSNYFQEVKEEMAQMNLDDFWEK